jgi:hypothetical protein
MFITKKKCLQLIMTDTLNIVQTLTHKLNGIDDNKGI